MRVAIIGAGRNRNGIGEYIGKYFHKHGAQVVAVLGRSEQSTAKAAAALKRYGIEAAAHTAFDRVMENHAPLAVVVASPTSTHAGYIEQCLAAGMHVFCDKPFISPDGDDIAGLLESVFHRAQVANLKVAMNSQWPFSIPFYEGLCGKVNPSEAETFFIRLSPVVAGREMIADSVPHALSILYAVLGDGEILDLDLEQHAQGLKISFPYRTRETLCSVMISLVRETNQPRSFAFGFNSRIVTREIDMDSYAIFFRYGKQILRIPDPLDLSVQDFISALRDGRDPHIGPSHIARTTILLQQIYAFGGEEGTWKN
jgi:hypothetical protein